ncbi:MAG: TonB-dependent receptor [Verrucomicrobiales bacterium]|nr:TonB-dependent receptor [Verrucomicrobiales bacterium]
MPAETTQITHQKAVRINLDGSRYGTFAEIGAGQETARWFFRAGGAANTVAKTMSAYDMTVSDSIYGPCERYVSRQRLNAMLDQEYQLLIERLAATHGDTKNFFVFANTVAAKAYQSNKECHGWLGVRFQPKPRSRPNTIRIHVRLLDKENLLQQEALGIIGVNLLHAACYLSDNLDRFIDSLLDGLNLDRIEIDLILADGPDYVHLDNRLLNVELVKKGLTAAVVFAPGKQVLLAAEHIYHKPLLIERGNFRPVTKINLTMLNALREYFAKDFPGRDDAIEIMEITLHNLLDAGAVDPADFLARVDILESLGKTVMISNYAEFHRLSAYLRRNTKEPIGIVVGILLLQQILDEKYYTDLEGGILESFGRLFMSDVKLYVYPSINETTGNTHTAANLRVAPNLRYLYRHLLANRHIRAIRGEHQPMSITYASKEIASLIANNDLRWHGLVTTDVANLIKQRGYFGYPIR